MPNKCKECSEDAMYDKPDGQRCARCGWTWESKTGLLEKRPTKPYDSDCGQVIEEWREHDNKEPEQVIGLCNDGSCCQFNPTTMRQTDDGRWIAVCTTHNND